MNKRHQPTFRLNSLGPPNSPRLGGEVEPARNSSAQLSAATRVSVHPKLSPLANGFVSATAYSACAEKRRKFGAFRRSVQTSKYSKIFTESAVSRTTQIDRRLTTPHRERSMEENAGVDPNERASERSSVENALWWTTLAVAVVAVPSFGFATSQILPMAGVGKLIVFVLACWLCTYLGMRMMDNPKMSQRIGSSRKKS
jgi:hypothetical protein